MAVAYRSSSASTDASGLSVVVTPPGSIVAGDLLLVAINTQTAITALPAGGWAELCTVTLGSLKVYVYWTIAGGSTAWTWTKGFSAVSESVAVACQGNSADTPVYGTAQASATATVTAPSVTPASTDNLLVCFFFAISTGTNAFSQATGMTEVQDVCMTAYGGPLCSTAADYQLLSTAAATGTRSSTCSAGVVDNVVGVSVLAQPLRNNTGLFFGVNA